MKKGRLPKETAFALIQSDLLLTAFSGGWLMARDKPPQEIAVTILIEPASGRKLVDLQIAKAARLFSAFQTTAKTALL